MKKSPLVSIVTIVKNGEQFIKPYLKSIEVQTYPNIELVIQDGLSMDRTVEFIKKYKRKSKLKLSLESRKDNSGAEAINNAISRCRGSIIGIINADDLLNPYACEIAVESFQNKPSAAALYGANKLIDTSGKDVSTFKPMPFDLLRLLRCELVPTTNGSFYNLTVCKKEFVFDEEVKTCGDFGVWLSLSGFPVLSTNKVVASTRLSNTSSTCQPKNYDQFCKDKIDFIERYLSRFEDNILRQVILKSSLSGVYTWAAESILNLEGRSKRFNNYINRAVEYDSLNEKVKVLKNKARSINFNH